MGYFEGSWAPYVPNAERRRDAEREIARLTKKGVMLSPVRLEGRKIAKTFWGAAWCDNLERYRDFAYRLERGRSYVRTGLVLDLQIAKREVTAIVSGSDLYRVTVSIAAVAEPVWQSLRADCSGGIDTLVALLQGRFSKAVMARICRQETGLFPTPADIRFTCSCMDHASMCKHVAAALYGVGARLDETPELLFGLRAVAASDLLSMTSHSLPTFNTSRQAAKPFADLELAALFDLDMAAVEAPAAPLVAAIKPVKAKPKVKPKKP